MKERGAVRTRNARTAPQAVLPLTGDRQPARRAARPPDVLREALLAGIRAETWRRLEADAELIAHAFGLAYRRLEPERKGVRSRYGVCFSDGTIRIRLSHASRGSVLKYSSLVNTVCHELAHLRHFNHGKRFKAYYFRILEWARAEGIYRPAGAEEPPAQPTLF